MPSRHQVAGRRLRRPDQAETLPAAASRSGGVAWGGWIGQNWGDPPFATPHFTTFPLFSPPVEAAEDRGEPRHQIGHGEAVSSVFPDEFQRPTPARSLTQEQLLRGLENTCKPPRQPVKGRTDVRFPAGELFKPLPEVAGRCWGGGDFGGCCRRREPCLAVPLLAPKPPKSLLASGGIFFFVVVVVFSQALPLISPPEAKIKPNKPIQEPQKQQKKNKSKPKLRLKANPGFKL